MADERKRITNLPTATKLEDDDKFVIDNTRTKSGTSDTTAGTREISKDTVLETINDDISEKYYPELYSGGLATDKGITETEPYNYRASASIGNRCFDKLVGATIAWNQIVQNGNFASTSNWVSSSATLSVANNEATITLTGSSWNNDIKQATSFLANHIYLVALDDKMSSGLSSNVLTLQLLYSGESSYTSIGDDIEYSNTYKRDSLIIKPSSNATYFRISLKRSGSSSSGESLNIKNVNIFDITQMFSSTIADAIYTMEQATSGSGVAFFRKYFPNDYYGYNVGSLQSVNVASKKTVGKNLLNPTIRKYSNPYIVWGGVIANNIPNGELVLPSGTYTFSINQNVNQINVRDNPNTTIVRVYNTNTMTFSLEKESAIKIAVEKTSTQDVNDLVFQLQVGSSATAYEPYSSHTYPINSGDLRGIFQLDNGELKAYGDVLESDGQNQRNFSNYINMGELNWVKPNNYNNLFYAQPSNVKNGVSGKIQTVCSNYVSVNCNDFSTLDQYYDKAITVQKNSATIVVIDSAYASSSASDFKTAMANKYVSYELATPTTEQSTPFASPMICDKAGTEEFVDGKVSASTRDVSIPVGHESFYPEDLKEKLEETPTIKFVTQQQYDALPSSKLTDGVLYFVD